MNGDLTTIDFEPASFDAVVSFYVFDHVPRERLAGLLGAHHSWLAPGGFALRLRHRRHRAWTGEWLGATVFFSSFPAEVDSALFSDAGFTITRRARHLREPEGAVTFQWVLARR